jgi:hypothetical protein
MLKPLVRALNKVLRIFDARLVRASTFAEDAGFPPGGRADHPEPAPGRRPDPELDLDARLPHVRALLTTPLDFLMLGSSGDVLRLPRGLADKVHVFSVDAVAPGLGAPFTAIQQVVTPEAGKVSFVQRAFAGCSSVAAPLWRLVAAYGLEALFREKNRCEVESTSVRELALRHRVDRWHWIKTDLEGLDFEVVKSLGDAVRRTLVLQMELRFEPFYEGEPRFHTVAGYLDDRGFDLFDLQIERWRYVTPNRLSPTKGRATYCDAVFVNRDPGGEAADVLAQALILGILGYLNCAEHLVEPIREAHPEAVDELVDFLFSRMRGREPFLPYPSVPHVVTAAGD